MVTFGEPLGDEITLCGQILVSRTDDDPLPLRRVSIQNVSVCTGTTRTCVSTPHVDRKRQRHRETETERETQRQRKKTGTERKEKTAKERQEKRRQKKTKQDKTGEDDTRQECKRR